MWRIVISLCGHFIIDDYPLICDAITSQLLITHYFVVEFSSIVMLWLQNWWLPTILWIVIKHICIAMRSLQRWWLTTILLTDFFVLPLFRGSNSTNAVWRASRNARIFRRTFSWALLILFCDRIHMHCDAVTSKMMIDHYFVDRFSCFALFRGPNSTNAMRRAHEIVRLHENTIQHMLIIQQKLLTLGPFKQLWSGIIWLLVNVGIFSIFFSTKHKLLSNYNNNLNWN